MSKKIFAIMLTVILVIFMGCSEDKVASSGVSSVVQYQENSQSVKETSPNISSSNEQTKETSQTEKMSSNEENDDNIFYTWEDLKNDPNNKWKIRDVFIQPNPDKSRLYNHVISEYNTCLMDIINNPKQTVVHNKYCIICYGIYDINGDDIPELFAKVGFENTIRIYSYVDDSVKWVFDMPDMASILKNGVILIGDPDGKHYEVVTFNPDWSYNVLTFGRGWWQDGTEEYWIDRVEVSKEEYEETIKLYSDYDDSEFLKLKFTLALEKTE